MYTNTWGLYFWARNLGSEYIHPDDISRFPVSNTSVYKCIGEENGYLILQYRNDTYRVKPDLYRKVEGIQFFFEEKVRLTENPSIEGFIEQIAWHFEKNEAMYFISVNGKIKSKRYWAIDLTK